jgi:DNA-binding GntR family transcriptional regulator
VNSPRFKTALDAAAARLRAAVLAHESGAFLGNEDALQALLGVSKPTMRQAARLLEREGLIRVKRGNNGGYFGARPDPDFIEATISTYLEVLNAAPADMTTIASVLWVEAVRRATTLKTDESRALASRFRNKVTRLPDSTGFSELLELEQKIRAAVFKLINSPYIELIFRINANFARRHFSNVPSARDNTPEHLAFVASWRKTKLKELDAISDGDQEVATLLAQRTRDLLHRRVWG